MSDPTISFLLLLVPISLIGLWRWSYWLLRVGAGRLYRPEKTLQDWPVGKEKPSVSVVTPVYNEDAVIFEKAMQSWIDNGVSEIIAVIDKVNTRHIVNFIRKYGDLKNVKCRLVVTPKPGKRAALCDGIAQSKGDIIALVDSDTIWSDGVLEKTLPHFLNRNIGGATVQQRILEPKSTGDVLFDMLLWLRYREELPFLLSLGKVINTLSGRTAFYRREALLHPNYDNLHYLRHEFFFGTRGVSGDDKRLTHLIIEQDWHLAYVPNAIVYTPGLKSTRKFFKQRLRWTRNSWRADLAAVNKLWVFRHPTLAVFMIDRFIQPFVMLLGPVALLLAVSLQQWLAVTILLNWWLISRLVRTFGYFKESPKRIIYLPAYILYGYINALMKIYAFATTIEHSWATRWDKKRLRKNKRLLRRAIPITAGSMAVGLFMLLPYNFAIHLQQQAGASISVPIAVSPQEFSSPISFKSMTPSVPQPLPNAVLPTEVGRYKVKQGDTLSLIAERVGMDIQALKKLNGLKDPDKIATGDTLLYYQKGIE